MFNTKVLVEDMWAIECNIGKSQCDGLHRQHDFNRRVLKLQGFGSPQRMVLGFPNWNMGVPQS